jgi:NADH dehydrogenase
VRILVTGASGFIGTALCRELHARGHRVAGTGREIARLPEYLDRRVVVRIGAPVSDEVFHDTDVAVHLAHDYTLTEGGLEGFLGWYREIEEKGSALGVRHVFVSSYSARPDAQSVYGRAKSLVETHFISRGQRVVRPGLVLGQGGIFAAMVGALQRYRLVPVPGGRGGKVPFISLGKLNQCLAALAEGDGAGGQVMNAFAPELTSLLGLLRETSQHLGTRNIFLPVPATIALTGLALAERLGFQLPVRSDSLMGFIKNQQQVHFSNYDRFGIVPESLEEAIVSSFA